MKYQVVFGPLVDGDIRKARNWYERQERGLGDRFFDEFREVAQSLQQNAGRHSFYYRRFRRISLDIFPYKVFFVIEDNQVLVFRVLHSKRDHRRHLGR